MEAADHLALILVIRASLVAWCFLSQHFKARRRRSQLPPVLSPRARRYVARLHASQRAREATKDAATTQARRRTIKARNNINAISSNSNNPPTNNPATHRTEGAAEAADAEVAKAVAATPAALPPRPPPRGKA